MQNELSDDIVAKAKQIESLVEALPGIDRDEAQQLEQLALIQQELAAVETALADEERVQHALRAELQATINGL